MRANEVRIIIEAPSEKVFEYTVDPLYTVQWKKGVEHETVDSTPIGLGSKYTNNQGRYEVSDYERNKFFELTDSNGIFQCSYTYRKIDEVATELVYFEQMLDGSDLDTPMKNTDFNTLQTLIHT